MLEHLQPASVFRYFEEICAIPHTSFHEKQLSDYCVNFAKDHGLYYEQDDLGNVLICAPATPGYEDVPPLILQGHLDMVGDKTPECDLDLETDGLRLVVNGDELTADGTTLGADNGIAVAYALAILAADDIAHPPLEVVLTVSEEVGLLGATAMDLSTCKARRMLNLDSEEEGIFTVGCAGGAHAWVTIPMAWKPGTGYRLDFSFRGIKGGHSGVDIDKGLANANLLAGRFLLGLESVCPFCIAAIHGGVKDNVIPKDAAFSLLVDEAHLPGVRSAYAEFLAQVRQEYAVTEPNLDLLCQETGKTEVPVLTEESAGKLVTVLTLAPNGIQAMSAALPGLVETSLNLGIMALSETELSLCWSFRSSVPSAKAYLQQKVTRLAESLGGSILFDGEYPAWPLALESPFREQCIAVYRRLYSKEPQVVTIHAGLECGIFSQKLPGLDCVSMGPDMRDVHSVEETLSISSVTRVWEYIKALLAEK